MTHNICHITIFIIHRIMSFTFTISIITCIICIICILCIIRPVGRDKELTACTITKIGKLVMAKNM